MADNNLKLLTQNTSIFWPPVDRYVGPGTRLTNLLSSNIGSDFPTGLQYEINDYIWGHLAGNLHIVGRLRERAIENLINQWYAAFL